MNDQSVNDNLKSTETEMALKEWAIVCAALAAGKQILIIRKGGIDEGADGFKPEHSDFWLFPTNFHQDASALNENGQNWLKNLSDHSPLQSPAAGEISLQTFCHVEEVFRVEHESQIQLLESMQILSAETLTKRFHYREPGLWLLAVRAYQQLQPVTLPDSEHFSGCRSWVDLPAKLAASVMEPVLSDEEFQQKLKQLKHLLTISEIV
ncbi:MAG: DUF1802 family protein [Planctomycetaceae bacterium]